MEFISLSEVLDKMRNGNQPFNIEYCTADRTKKTGGKIISIEGAILSGESHETSEHTNPASDSNQTSFSKAPAHFKNATRNILILSSNQTRKLHIYLITSFNGLKVYW